MSEIRMPPPHPLPPPPSSLLRNQPLSGTKKATTCLHLGHPPSQLGPPGLIQGVKLRRHLVLLHHGSLQPEPTVSVDVTSARAAPLPKSETNTRFVSEACLRVEFHTWSVPPLIKEAPRRLRLFEGSPPPAVARAVWFARFASPVTRFVATGRGRVALSGMGMATAILTRKAVCGGTLVTTAGTCKAPGARAQHPTTILTNLLHLHPLGQLLLAQYCLLPCHARAEHKTKKSVDDCTATLSHQ